MTPLPHTLTRATQPSSVGDRYAREHIARAPLGPLTDVDPGDGIKPKGLWYGVDGDWRRWCEDEMPDWVNGFPTYTVDIAAARVLTIRDVDALDRLHDRYRVPAYPGARYADVINWRRLAAEGWDGLEIAPYQWERRLADGYLWYYGWDCASGVIWNASKIRLTAQEDGDGYPRNRRDDKHALR